MPGDPAGDRRSRLAVSLLYVVMGFMIGSWGARVPAVRAQIGAGDLSWGLANTIAAGGDIVGLGIVLLLVSRASTRRLAVTGAAGVLLAAPLLGFASSLTAVVGGMLLWYLSAQLLATPMGALAMQVQTAYGRPLLSLFNAAFSVAVFLGAGVGTAAAALDVSPGFQFTVANAVLGALLLGSLRWLPEEDRPDAPPGTSRRRVRDRFTPQLRLIAVLAFLVGLIASVSTQWSSLYVADELGGGAVLGGLCFALMSAVGVLTLLVGDRLTARYGGRRVLVAGVLLATTGLLLALALDRPAVAVAGLTVFAVGIACNNAIVDQFAASQPTVTPSEGISVSEMGQLPAFFLTPALIGMLAGAVGLRSALLLPVAAMLAMAVLVGRLRRYPAGVAAASRR